MSWNPLNWIMGSSSEPQTPQARTGNPGNFVFNREQLLSVMKEMKAYLQTEQAKIDARVQGDKISQFVDKKQMGMFEKYGVENPQLAIQQLSTALRVYADDAEVKLIIYEEAQLEEQIVTLGETGSMEHTIDVPRELGGQVMKETKKPSAAIPKGVSMDDEDTLVSKTNNLNVSGKEEKTESAPSNNNNNNNSGGMEQDIQLEKLSEKDLAPDELMQFNGQLQMAKSKFAQANKTMDQETEDFLKNSLFKQFAIQRKYRKLIPPTFPQLQMKVQQKMAQKGLSPQAMMALSQQEKENLQKEIISTLSPEDQETFERVSPLMMKQQMELRAVMMGSQKLFMEKLGGAMGSGGGGHSHSHGHGSGGHSHSHASDHHQPTKPLSAQMEE